MGGILRILEQFIVRLSSQRNKMTIQTSRKTIDEYLKSYREIGGAFMPGVSIRTLFNEPEKLRDASYEIANYLVAKAKDEDRKILTSFLSNWKNYGGYGTIKQIKRLAQMYDYYEKSHQKSDSFREAEVLKMIHTFSERPEIKNKLYGINKSKEKHPFKKTRYEKEIDFKHKKKIEEKTNQATYAFLSAAKYAKKDKRQIKGMLQEILEFKDKLNNKEKFIINESVAGKDLDQIAKSMHVCRQYVGDIYHQAAEKLRLYYEYRDKSILDSPVELLGISPRIYNALKYNGIEKVKDCIAKTEMDVLIMKGISKKSLTELKAKLSEHKLYLRGASNLMPEIIK